MTKSKSRNPRTKKGARSAPTTKPAASKTTTAKRPKPKAALSKPLVTKSSSSATQGAKPTRKKSKVTASPANALTVTQRIVDALENLKGKDIVCMDVRTLTDVTDTLVIVSGTSNRHVKSLADNAALELKRAGHRAYNIEGSDAGEWVLVDFGDVVLHVMQPHIREFYDLEKLWGTPAADSDSANTSLLPKSPVNKKPSPKKPADKSKE